MSVFSALTSNRVYKIKCPHFKLVSQMKHTEDLSWFIPLSIS
jgi:HD-GYP domain-containing protein (c-di-GMP phosphodiesterase class II)